MIILPRIGVYHIYRETTWNSKELFFKYHRADIAPLMSTLIGIPYPMNSVGVLPLPYLNNTGHYKALAAFGNSKQILASFLVKEAITKKHEVFFKAFKPLQNHTQLLLNIEEKIDSDLIEEAESLSLELIQLSLKGLNYYQKYLELIV
jgi:phosphatidylinositol glycan class N